jgi:hypothetical protein
MGAKQHQLKSDGGQRPRYRMLRAGLPLSIEIRPVKDQLDWKSGPANFGMKICAG